MFYSKSNDANNTKIIEEIFVEANVESIFKIALRLIGKAKNEKIEFALLWLLVYFF